MGSHFHLIVIEDATVQCDFRDAHDPETDRPMGNRCPNRATHRIIWNDGRRYSYGCDEHLEIDEDASVKPASIEPLNG